MTPLLVAFIGLQTLSSAPQPTKLVTSHGKLGAKPKIQPSILKAFGGSAVRQPPTANSVSNPFSDGPGSTNANGGTTTTNGGSGGLGGSVNGRVEDHAAPAPKTAGPPPAKRPRPTGPGEPEYEPVASQVVRRAGTAFHYYCKDMRRKCEYEHRWTVHQNILHVGSSSSKVGLCVTKCTLFAKTSSGLHRFAPAPVTAIVYNCCRLDLYF